MPKDLLNIFKKSVYDIGYAFSGGKYGMKQRERISKTPEGQRFLEEYEKSFVGRLRRKIYKWTQSK